MDTNPAARPWSLYDGRLNDSVFRPGRTVCAGQDSERHAVAYCDYMWPERATANAELIVRAVNAHDDMLAALQKCEAVLGSKELDGVFAFCFAHGYRYSGPSIDISAIRDAIAKAVQAAAVPSTVREE